jgi:hypothetical protein
VETATRQLELEIAMTTLSNIDPTAEIACTLPVAEARGRLTALEDLVGQGRTSTRREGDRLRITVERAGDPDLETNVSAWAEAEKRCCAFLGFAIDSDDASVTLDITAPPNAGPTLDAFEHTADAAGRGPA